MLRDLKKSLWYGLKDIATELNPFRRSATEDGRSKTAPISHLRRRPLLPSSSLRKDEFFAVKDVSFELRRGECLSLIKPDASRIEMRGCFGARFLSLPFFGIGLLC